MPLYPLDAHTTDKGKRAMIEENKDVSDSMSSEEKFKRMLYDGDGKVRDVWFNELSTHTIYELEKNVCERCKVNTVIVLAHYNIDTDKIDIKSDTCDECMKKQNIAYVRIHSLQT
jgi:hypothetical protein